MKPIYFPEHNSVLAKDQPEYQPLPVFVSNDIGKTVISCWRLTFIERIKMLFTGKIYWCQMTFGAPLQPQYATLNKKEVIQAQEK